MSNLSLKWALLFLLLILLPVSVLAYLSVRVFLDERRSALVDLHRAIPMLQDRFDRRVADIVSQTVDAASADSLIRRMEDSQGVKGVFVLDAEGQFIRPFVRPLTLSERRPAFEQALFRGEDLAFREEDLEGARAAYEAALSAARTDAEKAEALNALGRCAARMGDDSLALSLHRQLAAYALAFDADGAHPLTLSTLRIIRQFSGRQQAVAALAAWTDGMISGAYPMYPGCRQAVRWAREWATQRISGERLREPLRDLDRLEGLIGLTEIYVHLQRAGAGQNGQAFRSGADAQGRSFLVYLRSQEDGATIGILFDLEAMGSTLMRFAWGKELATKGFDLSVFDVAHTAAFEQAHGDAVQLVTAASMYLYRMSLGIYSRDSLAVLQRYRTRNTLILMGIVLLSGIVVLGVTLIYRDATREVQTARLRSEFVANVSHELRTPLTAIRMYAETLLMGRYRNSEQMQGYLKTVMQESLRLSRMVGNILDFSRMESGRKTYAFEDVDLGSLVRATLEEFGPVLQEQEFAVALEIDDALPGIRADREAVVSAVANLIHNAVKYSPGRKEIRIAMFREGNGQVVEIADRGIGVPTGAEDAIFQKFQRADNAASAATGTGLGLALVKGITTAHGGEVTAGAREGGGSVFRLILPQGDRDGDHTGG